MILTPRLIQRFWNKVSKTENCWKWKGPAKSTGYGQLCVKHGTPPVSAHRLSWLIHFGEIPDGQCVCHRCDNRICVRPDHLFLGTQSDNLKDMNRKGRRRGPTGTQVFSAKLDPRKVRTIFSLYWESHRKFGLVTKLAKQFGVDRSTIYSVIKQTQWKHIKHTVSSS